MMVGPFLARAYGPTPIGSAYLLVTALYAVAVWHTHRIDRAAGALGTERPPLPRLVAQLADGIRYMLSPSPVLILLLVVTAHCTLTMSYDALLPLLASQVLHGDGGTYSTLAADTGIGAIAGTLILAAVRPGRSRVGLLLIGALGSGLTPALLAVARSSLVAQLAAAGMGGTQALFMTLMLAVLLQIVPDELRGRAAGLYLMSNAGAMAIANLALGTIADAIGPSLPLLIPGLTFAALCAIGVVLWPSALRPVMRRPAPVPTAYPEA
jgi:MFS family permease